MRVYKGMKRRIRGVMAQKAQRVILLYGRLRVSDQGAEKSARLLMVQRAAQMRQKDALLIAARGEKEQIRPFSAGERGGNDAEHVGDDALMQIGCGHEIPPSIDKNAQDNAVYS